VKDKESILVVDDDPGFLQIARAILQTKGYEVEVTPSAAGAISIVKQRLYNVAILDISLPDIEGTELLSTLLEIRPDMMAIMLTGHSSVQNAVQSLNRGAFAYLEKPLDPEYLLSVIARGLEKQRLVFENRHLLEEQERHNRETGILLAVSQGVSQSLDLQQIIDSALEKVAESMDIDADYVYLFENDHLVLKGCCGFTPQVAEEMKLIEANEDIIDRSLSRQSPWLSVA